MSGQLKFFPQGEGAMYLLYYRIALELSYANYVTLLL